MTITDPRTSYDDLLETRHRETVEAETVDEMAASEAAIVGWVVLGFVFDAAGRVLLIEEPWADGWLAPGGVPMPEEPLTAALTREVREETGIEIEAERPRALDQYVFEHERTGATGGWKTVCFEATARTTTLDAELGLADEIITDAEWFEALPESVHNRAWTERVYHRCDGATALE